MLQRHRLTRRPGTRGPRLIAESSDEELECWISARDAVEVLVAIATARSVLASRAASERAGP